MNKSHPGSYVRTKRSLLKNMVSRTTGKFTNYGAPKNISRPQPSMPKFKCLEDPQPE